MHAPRALSCLRRCSAPPSARRFGLAILVVFGGLFVTAGSAAAACTCDDGYFLGGQPIDPADTSCGLTVCGRDDQLYVCGPDDNAWHSVPNTWGCIGDYTTFGINTALTYPSRDAAGCAEGDTVCRDQEILDEQTERAGILDQATDLGMSWILEIQQYQWNGEEVIRSLHSAFDHDLIPILRTCSGDYCEIARYDEDTGQLGSDRMAAHVAGIVTGVPAGRTVYIISGVNEPDKEFWLRDSGLYDAGQPCDGLDPESMNGSGCANAHAMNAMIDAVGGDPEVRLLSPAFDCINTNTPALIAAMDAHGARFDELDGMAMNTYNSLSGPAKDHIDNCRGYFAGISGAPLDHIIVTEIGMIEIQECENFAGLCCQVHPELCPTGNETPVITRPEAIHRLREEMLLLEGDPAIAGILFFNGFGSSADPLFAYNVLRDEAEWDYIRGGDGRGETSCSCDVSTAGGYDPNFCNHPPLPALDGCPMIWPGGFCDPDGNRQYDDADWALGYYMFEQNCGTIGCGNPCAECLIANEPSVLATYGNGGWDTSCGNWPAITDDWCTNLDPATCNAHKLAACSNVCDPPAPTLPPQPEVDNPGFESQSTNQFGRIEGFGPAGAWAYHSQFPANGNGPLAGRFGYYSAGTTETVGRVLADRWVDGVTYTFRSWAIGGGNRIGRVPYQLGYAQVDDDLSSFVELATHVVDLTGLRTWSPTEGVEHTPTGGPEVGRQIIIRLGSGADGGASDIWFDEFEVYVGDPPALPFVPPSNLDIETHTSSQFGYIDDWGPSGAWAYHSQFPADGRGGLGATFGYYSAGTSETVAQIQPTRFEAGRTYTFKSYAIGGGNRLGTLPYQIGYLSVPGDLTTFEQLAKNEVDLNLNEWVATAGVSYTAVSGGPEIGKRVGPALRQRRRRWRVQRHLVRRTVLPGRIDRPCTSPAPPDRWGWRVFVWRISRRV